MSNATVLEYQDVLVATYTIVVVNTDEKNYAVIDPLLTTIGKAQYNDLSSVYRNQFSRIPVTIFK